MTKKTLLKMLQELQKDSQYDYEIAHIQADNLLLDFINDNEIKQEFEKIIKYYA